MKGLLKTWLWMLALSLAVGLAIGTCVRRDAERPHTFIGSARPDGVYERLETSYGLRTIASRAASAASSSFDSSS